MWRRDVLRGGLVAVVTGITPGVWWANDRFYPATQADVREAAQKLRSKAMTAGGGTTVTKADDWSQKANRLLRRRFTPELAEACSWLWISAGMTHYDVGDFITAKRLLLAARAAADQTPNTSLQTRSMGVLARVEIDMDRPTEARARCQQARTLDGLTLAEHAMLWSLEARASGVMDNPKVVDRCAGRAREALAEGGDRTDRPWSAYYDQAHQAGDLGAAYVALLRNDRRVVAQATTYQSQAIEAHVEAHRRSKALSTVSLATVEVAGGDFDRGVFFGHEAVTNFADIDSWRLRQGFDRLVAALQGHDNQATAMDLAGRIRETV
jgi:hypothetical protein